MKLGTLEFEQLYIDRVTCNLKNTQIRYRGGLKIYPVPTYMHDNEKLTLAVLKLDSNFKLTLDRRFIYVWVERKDIDPIAVLNQLEADYEHWNSRFKDLLQELKRHQKLHKAFGDGL